MKRLRIEHALDQGQNRLLVAMATGTGKTRLAIGLIYRLIKSGRFRCILFVVNRNALENKPATSSRKSGWKNEDIAADLISFVRRQALGVPLIGHEERIKAAMARVYALKPWTAIQRQWLERIEKQLVAQTVIDRTDFDQGAFAAHGGFNRLNKIFQSNFQQVLDDINATLYPDQRQSA